METTVSVYRAIAEGLENLKANFWPCILIIVILGILDSIGSGPAFKERIAEGNWYMSNPWTGGSLAFLIGTFIKPVFDYGAKWIFARGNRGEIIDVKDITEGFSSKELYFDIILTNIILIILIVLGFVCLILPGIYVICRTVLAPYLVIDKGLAPRKAISASWELTRDFWPKVIGLGIVALVMMLGGLCLLVIGIIPAFAWIKAMFAAFYQQILDAHSEEFLLTLDIEP